MFARRQLSPAAPPSPGSRSRCRAGPGGSRRQVRPGTTDHHDAKSLDVRASRHRGDYRSTTYWTLTAAIGDEHVARGTVSRMAQPGVRKPRGNLRAVLTSFVGRRLALAAVRYTIAVGPEKD